MADVMNFWSRLGRGARWGLAAGIAVFGLLLVASAWWALHVRYEVLFARLKPQDASAMVAELEKMKVPYQLADDGGTILVDAATVHATRLKLMGRELPLHGAVGFELFNNADFGMTEFAQKINYQRALQGEITRTILSLGEVRDARVHLVLPEEGLFKRATHKAKAAITLSLHAGQTLAPAQIAGVQKLVSAAVPGVSAEDVTIVDQRGVALTRAAGPATEAAGSSARLDLKRETEELLARKAQEVLDRAFGSGQAIATVDASLSFDQVRTTTEDVVGLPGRPGQGMTGVIVRERETARDAAAPLDVRMGDMRPATLQREVDYQAGRRVEQVVSPPGAVRKLQVVAVVKRPLDAEQLSQMKQLLAAAVGAVPDRGDVVVVQSLSAFDPKGPSHDNVPPPETTASPVRQVGPSSAGPAFGVPVWLAAIGAALAALSAGLLVWFLRSPAPAGGARLTTEQQQALADQLQSWLARSDTPEART